MVQVLSLSADSDQNVIYVPKKQTVVRKQAFTGVLARLIIKLELVVGMR